MKNNIINLIIGVFLITVIAIVVYLGYIFLVFLRDSWIEANKPTEYPTIDEVVIESKKCLDAGLDWKYSIGGTRIWCIPKGSAK